jgi:hypothetical protein
MNSYRVRRVSSKTRAGTSGEMFRRTNTAAVKDNVTSGKDLATALARDRKFRKHLVAALAHGAVARRRAAQQITMRAVLMRLAADEELRRELETTTQNLQRAWRQVEKKRTRRLRNTLLVIGGTATAVGIVQSRGWIRMRAAELRRSRERTGDEERPVVVPVPTAGVESGASGGEVAAGTSETQS